MTVEHRTARQYRAIRQRNVDVAVFFLKIGLSLPTAPSYSVPPFPPWIRSIAAAFMTLSRLHLVAPSGRLPDSLRTFQDNKSFSSQIVVVTGSRQQPGKPLIHVDGPGRTANSLFYARLFPAPP